MWSAHDLIERGFRAGQAMTKQAKVLEAALRSAQAEELAPLGLAVQQHLGAASLTELLLALFNEVSLSPWTTFVDKALDLCGPRNDDGRAR